MKTVLDAARERVARVFDDFESIVVSVSGGKDSTILLDFVLREARLRDRQVEVFFLDQEAEYEGTVDQMNYMMRLPHVVPRWIQAPLRLTNATSHQQVWLNAWHDGESWLRPLSELGEHRLHGAPDRFHEFFAWFERQYTNTAFFVGLRARESLNRWRAITRSPGYQDILWSTKASGDGNVRVYPIFDWFTGDVWKYIADEHLVYNRVYDQMVALSGANEKTLRVSNLIHEQAFRSLTKLQEIEPHTYAALLGRLQGVHCAALYANEAGIYAASTLPDAFESWLTYRDYLLETTPSDMVKRWQKRFAAQEKDEVTYKQQCKQLLTNDWENNVPVIRHKVSKLRAKLWDKV